MVKRGYDELSLDLDGGFSAGSSAALAIVEGKVRLQGTAQTLSLDALNFGELGELSGNRSLAGLYGWFGYVAVPEPNGLLLATVGLLGLGCWRTRNRLRQ
ncbi:PEP-CTERM sorting domain-containing protein [Bythopirellula goksoeyrii]|uniref:PEP-CTERM sorting domain-containing protein n=1 Tax=Bythopirellula goksoeyrii TaxID=1400387 RepID=UPI0011CE4434|nr:PEP-CTERM sorting domain-containing protein [Bythopirellula goksoeyrii]